MDAVDRPVYVEMPRAGDVDSGPLQPSPTPSATTLPAATVAVRCSR